jgi:hypothetical protein
MFSEGKGVIAKLEINDRRATFLYIKSIKNRLGFGQFREIIKLSLG